MFQFILRVLRCLGNLNERGAITNDNWFIHAVTATVIQLSQMREAVSTGSCRVHDGVKGKTDPWNTISSLDMQLMASRDGQTNYSNSTKGKVRAQLLDFGLAVMLDDFDAVKMLADPKSEESAIMGYALQRKKDDLCLGVPGRTAAAASGAAVGGFLGMSTVVSEAAETTTSTDILTTQQGVNASTNLTLAKVRTAKLTFDNNDVLQENRFLFVSPSGMQAIMKDNTATSADYNTMNAIATGQFPRDATFYGFKWRQSTRLPKTGNIRQCIAVQSECVGYSVGLVQEVSVSQNPERWNNWQAIVKLSAAAVRIDPVGVYQLDIDETA